MRKLGSWKKEKHNPEIRDQKARDKFVKHFVQKPKILLENFPVETNPETWKKPKRPPRTDIALDITNELHSTLITSLVQMYSAVHAISDGHDDDDDASNEDESNLPPDLVNNLYLSLTKMRAMTYNIDILESDEEIIRKARKNKYCHLSTASLAASLISMELSKLKLGVRSQDWWFSERFSKFGILKSQSEPTCRQVGNLQLTPWDNVQVPAGKDWTIQDLIDHMEGTVGFTVDMITQNSKIIYMKALPTHVNKKKKT